MLQIYSVTIFHSFFTGLFTYEDQLDRLALAKREEKMRRGENELPSAFNHGWLRIFGGIREPEKERETTKQADLADCIALLRVDFEYAGCQVLQLVTEKVGDHIITFQNLCTAQMIRILKIENGGGGEIRKYSCAEMNGKENKTKRGRKRRKRKRK
jgi:hypothetical protein